MAELLSTKEYGVKSRSAEINFILIKKFVKCTAPEILLALGGRLVRLCFRTGCMYCHDLGV
jgi:hypothetical protein